ncbi:MAG: CPBP family intramembrane metalloprotease [Bacteroidales bacterium]|nr:CPBP family intramembrane metalloprotease [Bacteroidales bacterium]
MKQGVALTNLSAGAKLLAFLLILIVFYLIFSLAGLVAGKLIYHLDWAALAGLIANPNSNEAVSFLYLFQFINSLGTFILAPLFFIFLTEPGTGRFLQTRMSPNVIVLFLAGVSMYTVLPFINYLSDINAHMAFPQSLAGLMQWMKDKQAQANEITTAFLSVKGMGGLSLNLFIVALMPAIGEELVFRGVIQQHLIGWLRNKHVGVWLTAILFSAVHLEFFGFLPRLVLGLMLGYLYVYSRNLWVPIFAHFVNNASSIIIFYLHYNGYIHVKMENFGAMPGVTAIVTSLILTLWIFYFIKKNPWVKVKEKEVGE